MAINPQLKVINADIRKLGNAEKITKAVLRTLSRSLLHYVMLSDNPHDVDAVNRTLAVLTPMNKATAIKYFSAFLPFKFDEDTKSFGKMDKKKEEEFKTLVTNWLAEEQNDIWSWAVVNVEVKDKVIDWNKLISGNIKKAIEADVDKVAIIKSVISGGLNAQDMLGLLAQLAEPQGE